MQRTDSADIVLRPCCGFHVSTQRAVGVSGQSSYIGNPSSSRTTTKNFKSAIAATARTRISTWDTDHSEAGVHAVGLQKSTERTQLLIIDAGDTHKFGLPEDQRLIGTLCQAFEERWQDPRSGECVIVSLSPELLIRELTSGVPQYESSQLGYEGVRIENLLPLPSALEEFKLARWDLLSRAIERHGLPESFAIKGSPWACSPPVIEVYPNGMQVIIDGTHRVFSARARGKETISAIVVKMASFNSPAVPRAGWSEVSLGHEKLKREDRYDSFDEAQFRPIRAAFQHAASIAVANASSGERG